MKSDRVTIKIEDEVSMESNMEGEKQRVEDKNQIILMQNMYNSQNTGGQVDVEMVSVKSEGEKT